MLLVVFFSNGGESNASVKLDHDGSAAHLNPTQSVDTLKGMNHFFHWNSLGESFLDFTFSYNHHNAPALRRDTDETTPISHQFLNLKHYLLHETIGFRNEKRVV